MDEKTKEAILANYAEPMAEASGLSIYSRLTENGVDIMPVCGYRERAALADSLAQDLGRAGYSVEVYENGSHIFIESRKGGATADGQT